MKKQNSKKIGKILTIGALLFVLFAPAIGFVHATTAIDDKTDYVVLAPLPGTTDCTGDMASSGNYNCNTNLSNYLPGVFNLVIGLAGVLAFVMLTYGGVLYMTSDAISNKSEGKKYITNALTGLGITIASWLIIFTINPDMVKFNLTLTQIPAATLQSGLDLSSFSSADASVIANASATAPGLKASGTDILSGTDLTNDQNQRQTLSYDGIGVNAPPCSATLTNNCTDVNLLKPALVNNLANVAIGCATSNGGNACPVVITGGNEAGLHSNDTTHSTGDTVDLAPTGALNKYLGNTNPANGTQITKNGITFTYETNGANAANTGAHWHATTCTSAAVSSCP